MKSPLFQKFLLRLYNVLYTYLLSYFSIGFLQLIFWKKKITNPKEKGIPLNKIVNNPFLIENINRELNKNRNPVIGTIDQRGYVISEYDLQLNIETFYKSSKPRDKFLIEIIVLKNGSVALKKNHVSYAVFFRELWAMHKVAQFITNVPKIYDYNIFSKYILMQFLDGENLKEILRKNGAGIDLNYLFETIEYQRASYKERYIMRQKIEKKYLEDSISEEQLNQLNQDFQIMLNNNFIYQDLKYGNFVIYNDKIFWIDFEHCFNHSIAPTKIFKVISRVYHYKMKRHFEIEVHEIQ